MNLSDYFENTQGIGVLATADAQGKVDAAVYGRPHVMDEQTVAFIMADRLTHLNLQSNPHAAYLFVEAGAHYQGKRLFLTKIKEEENEELIQQLRRKPHPAGEREYKGVKKFLVYFRIDKILPLIGDKE